MDIPIGAPAVACAIMLHQTVCSAWDDDLVTWVNSDPVVTGLRAMRFSSVEFYSCLR